MRIAMILCSLLALWGCDQPKPEAEAVAPPPAEIKFPTSASSARYMYFDDAGRTVVVGDADEVPQHLEPYTVLILAARTNAPDGQVYRWVREESDAKVSIARLEDKERLTRESVAAWLGNDHALTLWENTVIQAQLSTPPAVAKAIRTTGKSKRPNKTKNRKIARSPNEEAAPTIEIVSISSGEADSPSARWRPPAKQKKVQAAWGWKDVTIYYTDSCGWCTRAMRWMDSNDVPYRKKNVQSDRRAQLEMGVALQRAGRSRGGVPTFVIGRDRKVMQGWNRDRFIELAKR